MGVPRSVSPGGGARKPRPPGSGGSGPDYSPLFAPGQIRVNERMLSGKVVKIGSPKKFFGVSKQWKYFVLYVDHRGPMNSGTIGMWFNQIFCSCVAIRCCFPALRVTFHWLSRLVALLS